MTKKSTGVLKDVMQDHAGCKKNNTHIIIRYQGTTYVLWNLGGTDNNCRCAHGRNSTKKIQAQGGRGWKIREQTEKQGGNRARQQVPLLKFFGAPPIEPNENK